MAEIAIRKAHMLDVGPLLDVSVRAYWSNFIWLEPDAADTAGYKQGVVAMFSRDIQRLLAGAYVAKIGGRVAGWGVRMPGGNNVDEMWVDPDFQGEGAGTALLKLFLPAIRADGHATATIDTHERNAVAIKLYERMGFVIFEHAARFSNGLQRDVPVVLMRADLS